VTGAGGLWTPPGADLGDFAGPEPDPRMSRFIGGLDDQGQPLQMTYRRTRSVADGWVVTAATPDGPATLLKAARDMFALGYYSYELVACSNAWSLFGVEAALKLRLGASERTPFGKLIKDAKEVGLVSEPLEDLLDTGREIRNRFVHEGTQPTWTLGMAGNVIGTSFKIVAELYPDISAGTGHPEVRS
jgi:hypothetical protein